MAESVQYILRGKECFDKWFFQPSVKHTKPLTLNINMALF